MNMQEDPFPGLGIQISDYKQYRVIKITKARNIDLYNCSELKEIFDEGNKAGIKDWLVDLKEIKFIDSSGLGVLANQAIYLKKIGKKLNLLSPQKTTQHLFLMTGFSEIFKTVPNLDELSF